MSDNTVIILCALTPLPIWFIYLEHNHTRILPCLYHIHSCFKGDNNTCIISVILLVTSSLLLLLVFVLIILIIPDTWYSRYYHYHSYNHQCCCHHFYDWSCYKCVHLIYCCRRPLMVFMRNFGRRLCGHQSYLSVQIWQLVWTCCFVLAVHRCQQSVPPISACSNTKLNVVASVTGESFLKSTFPPDTGWFFPNIRLLKLTSTKSKLIAMVLPKLHKWYCVSKFNTIDKFKLRCSQMWKIGIYLFTHVYGSDHEGAAVLLPDFVISWLQNQVTRQPDRRDLTHM